MWAEEAGRCGTTSCKRRSLGGAGAVAVEWMDVDVAGGAVHVWLARRGRGARAVPRVPDGVPDLRPSRTRVAASRHVPAPDPAPRARAPRRLPDPRRGAERGP